MTIAGYNYFIMYINEHPHMIIDKQRMQKEGMIAYIQST